MTDGGFFHVNRRQVFLVRSEFVFFATAVEAISVALRAMIVAAMLAETIITRRESGSSLGRIVPSGIGIGTFGRVYSGSFWVSGEMCG